MMLNSLRSVVPITPLAQVYQAIAQLRQFLQRHLQGESPSPRPSCTSATFEHLAQQLNLTTFEQFILLLCVAMELDLQMASLYGQVLGTKQPSAPTFALALVLFPQADWQALATQSPLLRWQLIELAPHPTLAQAPLKIQPRILAFLLGMADHDPDLAPWVQPVTCPSTTLAPFYQSLMQAAAQTWDFACPQPWPLLQLCGGDALVKTRLSWAIAQSKGGQLWRWSAATLPTNPTTLNQVQQRWQREALLGNHVLLVEGDRFTSPEQQAALTQFLETLPTPVIFSSREPQHFEQRRSRLLTVHPLPHREKDQLWQQFLRQAVGERATPLQGKLDPLITQFDLNSSQIQAACAALAPDIVDIPGQLWDFCRGQLRPRLEQRAQRIASTATWADLILPPKEQQVLEALAMQVRQRAKVYQDWGFASKGDRGLGITVLFAGPVVRARRWRRRCWPRNFAWISIELISVRW